MKSTKLLLPIMTLVLVGGTFFVVPQAHAEDTSKPAVHENFFTGLVTFLEQKFGLDKTQVANAVNEYKAQAKTNGTPRKEMSPADMQAREKTRLDKLVSEGKITAAQEQSIIDEMNTLHTKYPMDQNLSKEQRKTNKDNMMKDLKAWAKAQGIDETYLMPMRGKGFGPAMRGHMGPRGNQPTGTVTPTPAT